MSSGGMFVVRIIVVLETVLALITCVGYGCTCGTVCLVTVLCYRAQRGF
jgi:hypothetical protein